MGLVLDIVPNHMGINDPCNTWWLDVLENGPSSLYAPFFDVAWEPSKPELKDRVLLPVLEDQYGAVLEAGKLKLAFAEGGFRIEYYDNRFPVAPGTYAPVLQEWLVQLRAAGDGDAGGRDEAALELESIITAVGYLPGRNERDEERKLERAREKESIKRRLAAVWQSSPAAFGSLQRALTYFNGDPHDPQSFDPLDALLEKQPYRLAYWRVAGEEINYRRFFDIRDLAAIRVEDPRVFEATHGLALRLLAERKVTGLRIDHPDGLYDPRAYFRRLQLEYLLTALGQDGGDGEAAARTAAEAWLDAALDAAGEGRQQDWPLYVVAEKILSDTEPLPLDWAVAGTTGYDFLASVNAVLVDPAAEDSFTRIYADFATPAGAGAGADFEALTVQTQRLIMREALASEINELSHSLERVAERNRHTRDFTLNNLRDAIRSLVASLGVYRTYIDPETRTVSERDRHYVVEAVQRAGALSPHIDPSVFRFLQETLLLQNHEQFHAEDRLALGTWVMKFQQMTGPVMAKGVEDTAFYRYNRLVSLNEVGGHPSLFGIDPGQFHRDNERRARLWPHSMLATSTHDNKRSEDVRARIDVLSEMPGEWGQRLLEWSSLNVGQKARGGGAGELLLPDRNDEYLLYQTLLGAWPFAQEPEPGSPWGPLLPPGDSSEYSAFAARIAQYMNKAVKEAKVHGSWINPDEAYDRGAPQFHRCTACARPGEPLSPGICALCGPHRDPRAGQLARPGRAQADVAGRARHLPGQRAVGLQPGRSRQPAAGGLRAAPGAAGGAAHGGAGRRRVPGRAAQREPQRPDQAVRHRPAAGAAPGRAGPVRRLRLRAARGDGQRGGARRRFRPAQRREDAARDRAPAGGGAGECGRLAAGARCLGRHGRHVAQWAAHGRAGRRADRAPPPTRRRPPARWRGAPVAAPGRAGGRIAGAPSPEKILSGGRSAGAHARRMPRSSQRLLALRCARRGDCGTQLSWRSAQDACA